MCRLFIEIEQNKKVRCNQKEKSTATAREQGHIMKRDICRSRAVERQEVLNADQSTMKAKELVVVLIVV